MLAAGSRYETAETNGIAHFSEHMFFKGTERRPSAREIAGEIDAIGGEFNAFTGKEYTALLRQVRRRAPRRRARRARRHAPQLALRRRGDRAREGRDRRGDEHVLRHAARLHRRRLRAAPLRRPAARLGHHRPQGDGPRRRRATRSSTTSTAGTSRRAWCSASRAASATTLLERAQELLGDLERRRDRRAGAGGSRTRTAA